MLKAGDAVPSITLHDDEGRAVDLASLHAGRALVLYFYPKDDTPGCTNEAGQFGDLAPRFEAAGARIVGVSRDSVERHKKFKAKYELPFTLLADTESKLCDAFGVIVEKSMYGKKSMGVQRSTFLIDSSGTIVRVWPKVKVPGHAEEVLASLP